MPDRITNTIHAFEGNLVMRPTVINYFEGDLGSSKWHIVMLVTVYMHMDLYVHLLVVWNHAAKWIYMRTYWSYANGFVCEYIDRLICKHIGLVQMDLCVDILVG